jgi:hypothetical protein
LPLGGIGYCPQQARRLVEVGGYLVRGATRRTPLAGGMLVLFVRGDVSKQHLSLPLAYDVLGFVGRDAVVHAEEDKLALVLLAQVGRAATAISWTRSSIVGIESLSA